MSKLFPLAAAVLIGTTLLSCGGGGDAIAPPVLTTLSVSFPAGTIAVGQAATATAAGLDQKGAPIGTGTISWTTDNAAVATVDANGSVLGIGPGTAHIKASAGGKEAQFTVTVFLPPVATVTVAPVNPTLVVGENRQFLATTTDASGNVLSGRAVTWESSDPSKATVNAASGMVAAVATGPVTITATSEGKSGTSQVTVADAPVACSPGLQMAVGELRTLSSAERNSLCLGGGASASEYVLIPFNNSTVASGFTQIQITGTNTAAIQPGQLASVAPVPGNVSDFKQGLSQESFELEFRKREFEDLTPVPARLKRAGQSTARVPGISYLTGIAATPNVGDIVQINASTSFNCNSAKELHDATVAAVLPHTLVLIDNTAPVNGYTPAELFGFGQEFENNGYPLDVQNFGAPSDFDNNQRIAILFTPAVNAIPFAGGVVLGLFAGRDLFPATVAGCTASNEGEMFYIPVPDPASTINNKYTNKAGLSNTVLATLVHEFQHLINQGRRMYVNTGAQPFEQVWLNEGLSHIAEELLYYRISGNLARSNIDSTVLKSNTAAYNTYQSNNFGRLLRYLQSPEQNSPFSQVDGFEMRGAIWQLLRYSADRKGGLEQGTWFALVNSTTAGQQNFNNVFGDIITNTRDWAVAQFADDTGLGVGANYSHPSWNFRNIFPAITNSHTFPLLTHALLGAPLDIILAGGGAAYVRFSVPASTPATITTNSAGQPVPASVDFILLRTQ